MGDYYELAKEFASEMNTHFELIFARLMDDSSIQNQNEANFARALHEESAKEQKSWLLQASALLGGKNLFQFIDTLQKNEIQPFLRGLADYSDFPLPSAIKEKVSLFDPEEKREFLRSILEISPERENQESQIPEARFREYYRLSQFLTLATVWKDEETVNRVLNWFLDAKLADERIADAIGEYIKGIGTDAASIVTKKLEEELDAGSAEENASDELLQALTFVAKNDEQSMQAFYPTLRKAFKSFKNKLIPVICLGDLGSVRAVPLLRSFLENESDTIDRALYYEAISSIKRLGGSTKDLPDPFRDFPLGNFNFMGLTGDEE